MKPNVLLVVLDSVRARNTSLHGYERDTTPFLNEFAESATWYRQARAPSIHSIASHTSIFTGLHVDEHRLTEHESRIHPGNTIWEELSDDHGYETGLFTPNVIVTESSNIDEGFDTVIGPRRRTGPPFPEALDPTDVSELTPEHYLRAALDSDKPLRSLANGVSAKFGWLDSHDPVAEAGDHYVEAFLSWESERDGPWAACLNFMDAHYPYRPKDEHDSWGGDQLRTLHDDISGPLAREFLTGRPFWQLEALQSLYDGCIAQVDAELEALVTSLKERDAFENTLVVITSDHGEAFGEPSELNRRTPVIGHSWGINEELTHVPLVAKFPDQRGSETVAEPATLTNFPSVVRSALAGEKDVTAFVPDGDVLVATHRLAESSNVLPQGCDRPSRFFGPWRAVYQTEDGEVHKYAARRDESVTLVTPDAQSRCAVADADDGVVETAFAEVQPAGVDADAGIDVDETVERKLEDLGYLR